MECSRQRAKIHGEISHTFLSLPLRPPPTNLPKPLETQRPDVEVRTKLRRNRHKHLPAFFYVCIMCFGGCARGTSVRRVLSPGLPHLRTAATLMWK